MFRATRPTTTIWLDLLPAALWRRGVTLAGDRLHFCLAWSSNRGPVRTIEWKGYNVAFGRRHVDREHIEREPSRWDDPDSYHDA